MFHAIIRSRGSVLHLLAEVDAYSLESLRQHVASAMREEPPVHVVIDVDAPEHDEVSGRLRRWAKRLESAGAAVDIGTLPQH